MFRKIMLSLIIVTFITVLFADTLEENLQKFDGNNAKGYLQPLANTLGTGLNSGFYNSAEVLTPFMPNLKVGFVYIGIPSSDKKFVAKGLPRLDTTTNDVVYDDEVKTATIWGGEGAHVHGYQLPDGADLPFAPFANASISLGLPFGNEIMVRGMPSINLGSSVGKLSFWGVGIKHSIDQYLTEFFPIHLSAQYVHQQLSIGDIVDISTHAFNLQASKKIFMLTVYGGAGYESANLNTKYNFTDPNGILPEQRVKLDLDTDNELKVTIGAKWSLFPFVGMYADYNIAKYPSVNAGLGIGF